MSAPVNDKTTKASLIIFEISEYLMGPWWIMQSFLIVPELQNETSVFRYNLIKSAKKFPYGVYYVLWIENLVYKSIYVYPTISSNFLYSFISVWT